MDVKILRQIAAESAVIKAQSESLKEMAKKLDSVLAVYGYKPASSPKLKQHDLISFILEEAKTPPSRPEIISRAAERGSMISLNSLACLLSQNSLFVKCGGGKWTIISKDAVEKPSQEVPC